MQNRQWNEHAKLWVFHGMETVVTEAPLLIATVVAMNSRHRFWKRWHIADVKNIAEDDQATLIVYQNYTDIDFTSTRLRLMLRGWRRLLEIAQAARNRHQKHRRGWPGNPKNRSKFRNYQNLCLRDQARFLEKHLFATWRLPLWCHCTHSFLPSLATAFVLTYEK